MLKLYALTSMDNCMIVSKAELYSGHKHEHEADLYDFKLASVRSPFLTSLFFILTLKISY